MPQRIGQCPLCAGCFMKVLFCPILLPLPGIMIGSPELTGAALFKDNTLTW